MTDPSLPSTAGAAQAPGHLDAALHGFVDALSHLGVHAAAVELRGPRTSAADRAPPRGGADQAAGTQEAPTDPTGLAPSGATRAVRTPFTLDAGDGELVVLLEGVFADRIVAQSEDEQLPGALVEPLTAVFAALATTTGMTLDVGDPIEVAPDGALASAGRDAHVQQLRTGDGVVGLLGLAWPHQDTPVVGADDRGGAAGATPEGGPPHESSPSVRSAAGMGLLHGVEMRVSAELGRTTMAVRDVLDLRPGSVVELDRAAGAPVDLLVNGTLIARGEVVVLDEEYAVRVTEIVTAAEGVAS